MIMSIFSTVFYLWTLTICTTGLISDIEKGGFKKKKKVYLQDKEYLQYAQLVFFLFLKGKNKFKFPNIIKE